MLKSLPRAEENDRAKEEYLGLPMLAAIKDHIEMPYLYMNLVAEDREFVKETVGTISIWCTAHEL